MIKKFVEHILGVVFSRYNTFNCATERRYANHVSLWYLCVLRHLFVAKSICFLKACHILEHLVQLTFALLSRKVIIFRQSSSSGNFAVIHLIDAMTVLTFLDYFILYYLRLSGCCFE